jgi:SAUR family protein
VREVPEGHVPVYVGEEMARFVVRTELLNRPFFLELLRRSAQEYGYEQRGVLRIPCTVSIFTNVLDSLLAGDGAHSDDDLLRSIDCDA